MLSFQLSAFVVYDKMLADLETNKLKLAIVYVTMTVVATINPLLVRKSVDGGVSFNVVMVESLGEFMKLVVPLAYLAMSRYRILNLVLTGFGSH